MKTKSRLPFEIKNITADGTFEGLLSPYGNVDQGRDVVEVGAYTKTLKEHGSKVPMLWFHKQDMPIGELELEDRPDGLWCKGKLLMDLPKAQEAYLLLKTRIVKGLSIGFESIKDSVVGGIRHLKEIKLYEGSIVMFPMNERALITAVKGSGPSDSKDFAESLAEIQTLDALYQMLSALQSAISEAVWSDLTRDEKIVAAETLLQQFNDTFTSFSRLIWTRWALPTAWAQWRTGQNTDWNRKSAKCAAWVIRCAKKFWHLSNREPAPPLLNRKPPPMSPSRKKTTRMLIPWGTSGR